MSLVSWKLREHLTEEEFRIIERKRAVELLKKEGYTHFEYPDGSTRSLDSFLLPDELQHPNSASREG